MIINTSIFLKYKEYKYKYKYRENNFEIFSFVNDSNNNEL